MPGEGFVQYKKAFKSNRYLSWISLMIHPKVQEITDGNSFNESIINQKESTLIVVLDQTKESRDLKDFLV